MLAKVAIARKQLALDETGYRAILQRETGVASARLASDAQLHRLLGAFGRLGFKAARPATTRTRSHEAQIRLIAGLWAELTPALRDPSAEALRAFVVRQTRSPQHPDGVSAPEFLDERQARKVVEALKAWVKRSQTAALDAAP